MSLRNRLGVEIHQASDPPSLASAASLGDQYWRADDNWVDIQPQRDLCEIDMIIAQKTSYTP
jgi:hypothetical protein